MITARSARLLKAAACLVLPFAAAQACGPDFFSDVFVRTNRPDLPQQFVQGRPGLLQTGFAREDFFVAYRYLNGGTLDAEEQKGWQPTESVAEQDYASRNEGATPIAETPQPEKPVAQWVSARLKYPDAPAEAVGQERSIKVKEQGGYEYDNSYLNCADDAFRTATATLHARAAAWGDSSAALKDWLHAQDVVFGNCTAGSAVPAAAPAGSPALLVQDRVYQVAAAHLYGAEFASAAAEFNAISKDTASPWQPSAGYLAGRALIRQAFFFKPGFGTNGEPTYDAGLMQAAGKQLQGFLAARPPQPWREAAEAQLALVRVRTEPEQRQRELSALVGGSGHDGEHDARYEQDVEDLLWLMNRGTPDGLRAQPEPWETVPDAAHPGQTRTVTAQEADAIAEGKRAAAWTGSQVERSATDLVDWMVTLQSLSAEAPRHALQQWRQKRSLPWLVAALMRTPDAATAPADLLQAAAAVPADSPAWQTVTYHRARLLMASGQAPAARAVLEGFAANLQALPATQREPSTVNAVRGLRMLAAVSVPEFLAHVPRTMLLSASEEANSVMDCQQVMQDPKRHYHCVAAVEPEQMDADAAGVLNTQAPLQIWLQAAKSPSLSAQLRTAVVAEGWTRAVLLQDRQAARDFLPLLPPALREQAGSSSGLAVWMTLARNPGLRPYLDAGTQRAYSYDFVESYRDNWCYRTDGNPTYVVNRAEQQEPDTAAFLSAAERTAGAAETARLAPLRSLDVGRRIVQAVQANPGDPRAAEALFLVLRMIRYGCVEPALVKPGPYDMPVRYPQEAKDLLQLKLDAARLLRRYYASSPWTKKAAPFAG